MTDEIIVSLRSSLFKESLKHAKNIVHIAAENTDGSIESVESLTKASLSFFGAEYSEQNGVSLWKGWLSRDGVDGPIRWEWESNTAAQLEDSIG